MDEEVVACHAWGQRHCDSLCSSGCSGVYGKRVQLMLLHR